MRCSVRGCTKDGENHSTIEGHCGDMNEYDIYLCEEHYCYLHGIDYEEENGGRE